MVAISTGMSVPRTDRTMKAKINVGIESIRSTMRDRMTSIQRPATAAVKPAVMPMVKERLVMISASPIEVRAPYNSLLKMSRPI